MNYRIVAKEQAREIILCESDRPEGVLAILCDTFSTGGFLPKGTKAQIIPQRRTGERWETIQ